MQAGPRRAEDLDRLHGRGTPPPLSAPLPMVLSARGNRNKLILAAKNWLRCYMIFFFFFTLISSRSWSTVKSGGDWVWRDALCLRRDESSHDWRKAELVWLFTVIFFFFYASHITSFCVWSWLFTVNIFFLPSTSHNSVFGRSYFYIDE